MHANREPFGGALYRCTSPLCQAGRENNSDVMHANREPFGVAL